MKLIDILVEELPKRGGWPKGAAFVAQEEGGWLWSFTSKPQKDCDDEWMDESSSGYHNKVGKLPEASDHDTSAITREQYEAALDAKNEGWIEWGGGKFPPVSTNTIVDVKFKKGYVQSGYPAGEYSWEHNWQGSNIIAYRLHQPQEVTGADDESDLNECIGQNPVTTWNGEGLPPAGCECEVIQENPLSVFGDWTQCKVINFNHRDGKESQVCIIDYNGDFAILYANDGYKFRPVRSEAERKRDIAAGKIFDVICKSLTDESESTSVAIYDAIAAGKVPGIKLED